MLSHEVQIQLNYYPYFYPVCLINSVIFFIQCNNIDFSTQKCNKFLFVAVF